MKIEKLDVRSGQFGPYTVARIGGIDVSAFGRHHDTLSRMKVGDDIEITYERKGNYDRITSINGSGGFTSVAPSGGNQPRPQVRDEFPVSMKVSYAKDLLVASTVGTAKEAVDLVNELIAEFKKDADPT